MNIIEFDELLPPVFTTLLFPSVAESIEVVGGVVSTVHVNDAED